MSTKRPRSLNIHTEVVESKVGGRDFWMFPILTRDSLPYETLRLYFHLAPRGVIKNTTTIASKSFRVIRTKKAHAADSPMGSKTDENARDWASS
jgi:hypothetical protein